MEIMSKVREPFGSLFESVCSLKNEDNWIAFSKKLNH